VTEIYARCRDGREEEMGKKEASIKE